MTRATVSRALAALMIAAASILWQRGAAQGQAARPADARRVVVPAAHTAAQATSAIARNPLRNAYFGDLHVHTSWSLDAFSNGDHRDDPGVAYRYGRGEAIRNPDGSVRAQLRVPLDFMAVTDHDSFLGETQICNDPKDPAYGVQVCQELRAGISTAAFSKVSGPTWNQLRRLPELCGSLRPDGADRCVDLAKHMWRQVEKQADAFHQPGTFTTFTGFEWTGMIPRVGGWQHRNVIFLGPSIPEWGGSAVEMKHSPERLWEWLEQSCTGDCQVLAIPHNTNYGAGVGMAPNNSNGTPFTREILTRRAKTEPLIEIHQIKGNSECAEGVGTTDEDCSFEQTFEPCEPGILNSRCAFASDYVRNALKTGMTVEQLYGINPFKYGIIGSTDDHKSAGGSTDEATWPGSFFGENGATIRPGGTGGRGLNPGGLAGVWAEANTRESIFAALKRRETFGTSGTRIRVRLFGGWKYPADLHTSRTLVEDAYKNGVPMGGDLPARPKDVKAPRFLVWTTKDPSGANLQRLQIVKGWTERGETFEKVFDIVCSDGLKPDARTHRCADNGATVELLDCSPTPNKGAAELSTVWSDPEFKPSERAFYYARVFENPTCRWSTYRALATNSTPPAGAPQVIQERAWSSPIWYTPAGR